MAKAASISARDTSIATYREMPADAVGREFGATPKPQLASVADIAPDGSEWGSEIKFDGYRLFARRERGTVKLITRNGLDWTARLTEIAARVATLLRPEPGNGLA